jgi:hypothetical protein
MGFFDHFRSTPAKSSTECECDICNKKINLSDGYLLTTKQVITKSTYWEYAFTHQWGGLHDSCRNKDRPNKKLFLINIIIGQANQQTPWALCETCSSLFEFDKKTAKSYAQENICPPNTGPAGIEGAQSAAGAFMYAWKKVYHEELPDLTREIRV